MKTLYGNAGSGPASKSIQRKTSQIPPYGYIAAIGLVASAEQAYAKQVGVSDVVTSTTINPDDNRDVFLDLSNLDVSGFTSDTTNLYASIIDLSGSAATIWNSTTNSLVSSIALGSGFRNITGTSGADSLKGNDQFNTINGGNGADTFVFLAGGSAENGINLITDFTVGTDKIRIQWEGNGSPTDLAGLGLTLSGSSRVQLRDSVTNELIANFSGVSQSALQNQIDSDFSSVFEIV